MYGIERIDGNSKVDNKNYENYSSKSDKNNVEFKKNLEEMNSIYGPNLAYMPLEDIGSLLKGDKNKGLPSSYNSVQG